MVFYLCGMFESCAFPFLCDSSDRVITGYVQLKEKCPYKQAVKNKTISDKTIVVIDLTQRTYVYPHHYNHYQFQRQMLCTGATCSISPSYLHSVAHARK